MPTLIYLLSDRGGRFFNYLTWILLLASLHIVFGIFNADELKLMNYEVDILSSPILASKDVDLPVLHMTSKFGQQYQCMLPQVIPVNEEPGSNSKETTNTDIPEIQELLKPLYNGPCLIKPKDWWTYELCVGQSIRQYHIEDSQVIGSVPNLGNYDSDYDWNSQTDKNGFLKTKQPRYHSQYYVNGSNCDITGKPRTTEVRFFCEVDAGDYISRVDEPETCHYIFTVNTDRVCSHPYLKPAPSTKPHTIQCNPVLQEEHYAKYMQKAQEVKEKAEKKRQEWIGQQQKQLEELKLRLQQEQADTKVPEVEVTSEEADEEDEEEEDQVDLEGMTEEEHEKLLSQMIKLQNTFYKDFDSIVNQAENQVQTLSPGESDKENAYTSLAVSLNTIFTNLLNTENDFFKAREHFKKIHQLLDKLQGVIKKSAEATTDEEQELLLKERAKLLETITKEFEKNLDEAEDVEEKKGEKGIQGIPYNKLASTLERMIGKLNIAEKDLAQASTHFKKVQKHISKLELSKENIEALPVEEQVKLLIERAKLRKAIINGFGNIPDEGEDEPEQIMDDKSDIPPTKLASTLNDLISKLEKGEKDLSHARSTYRKLQNDLDKLEAAKKKLLTSESDSVLDEEQEEEEEEEGENDSKMMPDFDNKVQVRIRKIASEGKKDDGKVHWFRQKDLDQAQKQKLEDAVRDKLEKAGLDANGRRIEVRIITAGYYNDEEDGKDFHVLTDEETQQFQNMILTLLTGSQEARKELERQRQMEKNYQFVWGEDQPLPEDAEES